MGIGFGVSENDGNFLLEKILRQTDILLCYILYFKTYLLFCTFLENAVMIKNI